MTSPHQDAAGVVAELRSYVNRCMPGFKEKHHDDMLRAANLIEQHAKALSEERFHADRMRSQMESFRTISTRVTKERNAVEASLAELNDYIEGWTSPATMKQRAGEMTAQETRTVQAVLSAILDKARSFLNSASNKEGAARAQQESSDADQ